MGVAHVEILHRARLSDRLDAATRVAAVIAAVGYGKTTAIQHWVERRSEPTAWLAIDPFGSDRLGFWRQLLIELRSVLPDLDDEAVFALEGSSPGRLHLDTLIAAVARLDHQATVVVDDIGLLTDQASFDDIEYVVERSGDRLRFVLVSRALLPLPIARWRAAGWLVELTEEHLRFSGAEAEALAAALPDCGLVADAARHLNEVLEGWPIAVLLSMMSPASTPGPSGDPTLLRAADLGLIKHLVDQVLDQLPTDVSDGAHVLSIAGAFDTELAYELLGPDAGRIIAALQHSRLLLSTQPLGQGPLRVHGVVAKLLEEQFRWSQPQRHEELHRRAAKIHHRRNELGEAYQHLIAIGDAAGAKELVIDPTLQLVDRGDRVGLTQMMRTLPLVTGVDDAGFALDVAQACFFAGDGFAAQQWCERAEALGIRDGGGTEVRWHSTCAVLALMNGELERAQPHVDAFVRMEPSVRLDGPVERSFATVGARLALIRRDASGARTWLDKARFISDPPVIADVGVPALQAWHNLMIGRSEVAARLVDAAVTWAEESGIRPHHSAFEALTTAAWVRYQTGDLDAAMVAAEASLFDSERLGYDWHRVRAGTIMARIRAVVDGPQASLAVVRDTRAVVEHGDTPLVAQLDAVEARALTRLGRTDEARELMSAEPESTAMRITCASIELADGHHDDAVRRLGDMSDWMIPERLEGEMLRAAASGPDGDVVHMNRVLAEAAQIGLVSPFLEHGGTVEDLILRSSPSAHRRVTELIRHRDVGGGPASSGRRIEPLTSRELTLLALLPTHLSYARMGQQVYVSVNTVKSNLKSIYRKLGVTTRAEAVDAARAAGLL